MLKGKAVSKIEFGIDDIEAALEEADREAEDPNTRYYTHEEMKKMARRIIDWRL